MFYGGLHTSLMTGAVSGSTLGKNFPLHIDHLTKFSYILVVDVINAVPTPPTPGTTLKFRISLL
jgi:hypothetical protein